MNFDEIKNEGPEPRAERTGQITEILYRSYPAPTTQLNYTTPLQLLVATILSAQCTDKRVNLITPDLFKKYPSAEEFASANIKELEAEIKSTGFYKNKAANIKACCQALLEKHGGEVPASMDELTALPGIGRKSANVILGNAFGIAAGIVVDTHVIRISGRLGLTLNSNPEKIEQDLIKMIPREQWIDFAHLLILHGRNICIARRPKCAICPVCQLCPSCNYTQT